MNNFQPHYLSRLDLDRIKRYTQLLDFYHGTHWEGTPRRRERRLTFNYAKVFIDKLTSYLMSGLSLAIDPLEEGEKAKALARETELAIQKVYQQNNLDLLDFDTEIDTAILGDGCYKVTWDQADERIRITAPDIQGIYAWWMGDDISRVWRVASRYTLSADEFETLYGTKPRGVAGSSKKTATLVELWTEQEFELWVDSELTERKPNPYGFIPFIIYPNLREPKKFWGISDLPQIIEPQRELNRAMSQLSRILELSGNPIAVLENVEESENIQIQPGAVWNIPEDARAYLLDLLQGGGVRLHIDYIDLLYRTLHDLSESPRAAFGGVERDISGVALEIDLHPLLQKVRRKRLIRTTVYKRRVEMILSLLERFAGQSFGSNRTRVVWGPVLPQDRIRLVQSEQTLVQSGIHSRRLAMDEMGIEDPELEFSRWLEERRKILEMNQQLRAQPDKGGGRVRAESESGVE